MYDIPKIKVFNGRKYAYRTTITGKRNARAVAKTMRDRGWKVRVVPVTKGSSYHRIYAIAKI